MTFVEIFIGRDQQRKRHPLPTYEEIEAIFEPAPIFDFSVTPEKHENMMFSQIDLLVRNLIPEHFDKLKAFLRERYPETDLCIEWFNERTNLYGGFRWFDGKDEWVEWGGNYYGMKGV